MIEHIWPYQSGKHISAGINQNEILFKDIHLSSYVHVRAVDCVFLLAAAE